MCRKRWQNLPRAYALTRRIRAAIPSDSRLRIAGSLSANVRFGGGLRLTGIGAPCSFGGRQEGRQSALPRPSQPASAIRRAQQTSSSHDRLPGRGKFSGQNRNASSLLQFFEYLLPACSSRRGGRPRAFPSALARFSPGPRRATRSSRLQSKLKGCSCLRHALRMARSSLLRTSADLMLLPFRLDRPKQPEATAERRQIDNRCCPE